MYREVMPYLACVRCGAATLDLDVVRADDDNIIDGALRCADCGGTMPIVDGILDAVAKPLPRNAAQLVNYSAIGAWGYERLWRWLSLTLLSGKRFPLRDELRLVRGLVEPERGGLMLDVACSTALYGRALVAPSAVVVSVDHSWAMLREAQRYARREGKPISFMRASAQRLPFRAGAANGYAIGGSLNEIGDINASLREARRVIAPQGRWVSMHLVRAHSRVGRDVQDILAIGGLAFPAADDYRRRFAAAGWRRAAAWRWRVVAIELLLPGVVDGQ